MKNAGADGPTIIDDAVTIDNITGDVRVICGGDLRLTGSLSGTMEVEAGGKAVLIGTVRVHLLNNGGEVWLNPGARVLGKVESIAGDLHVYNGLVGGGTARA
jgi:hypothetical protein